MSGPVYGGGRVNGSVRPQTRVLNVPDGPFLLVIEVANRLPAEQAYELTRSARLVLEELREKGSAAVVLLPGARLRLLEAKPE